MRTNPIYPLFVLAALVAPPAWAADDVVATVNGQQVKRTWLELIAKDIQDGGNKPDEGAILDSLVRNELLAQEAVRTGIDRQPDFAAREEMRRKELLANLLIRDTVRRNPIGEEALKAEYEKFKTALGDKEYNTRHIQLKTEAEAKAVIAQLVKGADFAKLANEKSQDAATREKGGQIGWFAKSAMTPPLGEAVAKLQKGQFTNVALQTKSGWHVLKLDDVRPLTPPSFDQVRERLRQGLTSQQVQKLVAGLRAKASIEVAK